jgi:orotidine-5'-phosphate decarboxylase
MNPLEQTRPTPAAPVAAPADARDRLIVALDFQTADRALSLVDRLDGRCRWFKVGLELYLSAGNSIVETLTRRGYSVFLDLKLHDIPNTVAGAVQSVAGLGAGLLTVHAAGGPAMLDAAARAAASVKDGPALLAVTVLTSMDLAQLSSIGVQDAPADQVLSLAKMAAGSGIPGLVCSPEEVGTLRASLDPQTILVTPGIRPAGSEVGDQKRIATPGSAISSGASYLVVGRPVTQAADPAQAADSILKEIADAYSVRN